jgi:hypothetical protein
MHDCPHEGCTDSFRNRTKLELHLANKHTLPPQGSVSDSTLAEG